MCEGQNPAAQRKEAAAKGAWAVSRRGTYPDWAATSRAPQTTIRHRGCARCAMRLSNTQNVPPRTSTALSGALIHSAADLGQRWKVQDRASRNCHRGRTAAYGRACFAYEARHRDQQPVRRTADAELHHWRERVLTDEEAAAIWRRRAKPPLWSSSGC